jgi:hypothetical protein
MGVWHNLPTFLYGCALSRLHSQPLMSLWLRASFDVSRYRAHASRALALLYAAAFRPCSSPQLSHEVSSTLKRSLRFAAAMMPTKEKLGAVQKTAFLNAR